MLFLSQQDLIVLNIVKGSQYVLYVLALFRYYFA